MRPVKRNVATTVLGLLLPIAVGAVLFGVSPHIPIFYVWSPVTELAIFAATLFFSCRLIVGVYRRHAVLIAVIYVPLVLGTVVYLSLRIAWVMGREFP